MLRNIEQLAGHFAASHVVLVENDSEDRTREVYNEWAGHFRRGPTMSPPPENQQPVGVISETMASVDGVSINPPQQAAGEPHQRRPPSHRTVALADGINLTTPQAAEDPHQRPASHRTVASADGIDLHQRPASHRTAHAHTAQLISFTADSYFSKKDLRLMAAARNMYLELLGLPQYAGVDYLIAVDTDMCHPWDQGRIIKVGGRGGHRAEVARWREGAQGSCGN